MRPVSYIFMLFMLITVACGSKSKATSNEDMLAGDESKTWKATKELTASGDKDKLTRDEKRQTITFSRNGNVKMGDGDDVMGGTWSFMDNTLSVQFTGTNVTENFAVLELKDNLLRLRGADGGELTMKPE
jgi:hypothetical protein